MDPLSRDLDRPADRRLCRSPGAAWLAGRSTREVRGTACRLGRPRKCWRRPDARGSSRGPTRCVAPVTTTSIRTSKQASGHSVGESEPPLTARWQRTLRRPATSQTCTLPRGAGCSSELRGALPGYAVTMNAAARPRAPRLPLTDLRPRDRGPRADGRGVGGGGRENRGRGHRTSGRCAATASGSRRSAMARKRLEASSFDRTPTPPCSRRPRCRSPTDSPDALITARGSFSALKVHSANLLFISRRRTSWHAETTTQRVESALGRSSVERNDPGDRSGRAIGEPKRHRGPSECAMTTALRTPACRGRGNRSAWALEVIVRVAPCGADDPTPEPVPKTSPGNRRRESRDSVMRYNPKPTEHTRHQDTGSPLPSG